MSAAYGQYSEALPMHLAEGRSISWSLMKDKGQLCHSDLRHMRRGHR